MPYGPYGATFEECVAKASSFADDPEAFCAYVKQQMTAEMRRPDEDELKEMYKRHRSVMGEVGAIRVVKSYADGSGIVEAPILTTEDRLELGGEVHVITRADFADIVRNFEKRAVLVPVSETPHAADFLDRAGPQPGFVEAVEARGDVLWGRVSLNASLFQKVKPPTGELRGFSVEMRKNLKLPADKLDGWALVGGIFTNRPATHALWKMAAEADSTAVVFRVLAAARENKETDMAENDKLITLAAHEKKVGELSAEVAIKADKVATLEAQIAPLHAEIKSLREAKEKFEASLRSVDSDKTVAQATSTRLEAQVQSLAATVKQLEAAKVELELKIKDRDQKDGDTRVKALVEKAVAAKIIPAFFDGYETGPKVWAEANYGSVTNLENVVTRMISQGVGPKALGGSDQKSGHDPKKAADSAITAEQVTEQEKEQLDRLHLDARFVGVTTAEEARKVHEQIKAEQTKK